MRPNNRTRRYAITLAAAVAGTTLLISSFTWATAGEPQQPAPHPARHVALRTIVDHHAQPAAPKPAAPPRTKHTPKPTKPAPNITLSPTVTEWIDANDHEMGAEIRAHESVGPRAAVVAPTDTTTTAGMDVSGHQANVDWTTAANNGAKFAYVKATEGTYYTNPYYAQQYNGAHNVGMVRGAYHFARPDATTGAVQADYFIANGGAWTPDGMTLPGTLDIEWDPYGPDCYGLTQSAMVTWIQSFVNEYHAKTTRWPTIYTATTWWTECTGTQGGAFAVTDPLWLARYNTTIGPMPYNWTAQAIWQYADAGTYPGDQDTFNGTTAALKTLAAGCQRVNGHISTPAPAGGVATLPTPGTTCMSFVH